MRKILIPRWLDSNNGVRNRAICVLRDTPQCPKSVVACSKEKVVWNDQVHAWKCTYIYDSHTIIDSQGTRERSARSLFLQLVQAVFELLKFNPLLRESGFEPFNNLLGRAAAKGLIPQL